MMFEFLKKLVSPEAIDLIGYARIKFNKNSKRGKRSKAALKLARRYEARQRENDALLQRAGRLFPPQQGHRRDEFSSNLEGQWSRVSKAGTTFPAA
jgi:hypothetical protein